MPMSKQEQDDFHQLDLAVTRLEARVQILSEKISFMQGYGDYPKENARSNQSTLFKGLPI